MKRTDNLYENQLTQMVTGLVADVTELKNSQRTSGRSGVLGYYSASSSTWDKTATVGSDTDTSTRITTLTVTFVGDGSQAITLANLGLLSYVNGTDAAHQLTPQNPNWTDGTRTANIQYSSVDISRNTYTQVITLTTLKQVTYYFKASAQASCRGTIGVA